MAKNPTPSLLDPGQIVKRAFDDANDRIRVDAAITAPDGSSILIDATTDSIKIGNTATGPFLNVKTDGSIDTNLNGLDVFQTSQYTVGTSAVQITPSALSNRSSVGLKAITLTSVDTIYIGNSSSVSTSNGWPLSNNDALQLDLSEADTIWAIATSAGQTLAAIELGN